MKINIENIRCVFCGHHSLDIYKKPLKCIKCGHEYPSYKGIKFLGSYNDDDTLGLMEITSKISAPIEPMKVRKNIEESEKTFNDKFESTYIQKKANVKKNVVPGSTEMAQQVRLREWAGFELLTKDVNFNNKLCLDIGAGLGSDSVRLINRGAKLVCLDYNPTSILSGSQIVPEAQWLGGNSDCLPFTSNTFDYTIANAALHHMNEQLASVKEMYRVTKPGGCVFLISDPFSKRVANHEEHEQEELRIFDNHPMVMNGVNEGVIPFNKYIEPLEMLDPYATILTMKIHENSEISDIPTYWKINSKSKSYLESRAGNISSLINVSDIEIPETIKCSEEIPTKLLFQYIGNPTESINFLLPHIPEKYFNNFPFMNSSKFLLMNGWNVKQDFNSDWRKGFNRVRLFLTRSFVESKKILIRSDEAGSMDDIDMYISINSEHISQFSVKKENQHTIFLNSLNTLKEKNVIEIGIADKNENKGAIWTPYNLDKSFLISIADKNENKGAVWTPYNLYKSFLVNLRSRLRIRQHK